MVTGRKTTTHDNFRLKTPFETQVRHWLAVLNAHRFGLDANTEIK